MSPPNDLSTTLSLVSAMFTPAVLVSACGSLILTTSQRLARSLDRQREVAGQLRQMAAAPDPAERAYLRAQLGFAGRRVHLLQLAMTTLHLTLGLFIASIFSIGVLELFHGAAAWLIALLSVLGASCLLVAAGILIRESALARADVAAEAAYLGAVGN